VKSDALFLFDRVSSSSSFAGLPIVVHGQSMGTLFAGYVATRRPVAAAVLESPPTTIDEVMKAAVPWYTKPFVRIAADPDVRAQDNAVLAGAVTAPVLYIVGDRDRVTPSTMARHLHDASPAGDKRLVLVRGGKHGDLVRFGAFWEALASLIDRATLPQQNPYRKTGFVG
jgi:pimeloyl-ACP methyl ester carboxylesterase